MVSKRGWEPALRAFLEALAAKAGGFGDLGHAAGFGYIAEKFPNVAMRMRASDDWKRFWLSPRVTQPQEPGLELGRLDERIHGLDCLYPIGYSLAILSNER
jgi:hypothetical protein